MNGCIVVVSGDDESCSTALIRFGSVYVAGYRVAGCGYFCLDKDERTKKYDEKHRILYD